MTFTVVGFVTDWSPIVIFIHKIICFCGFLFVLRIGHLILWETTSLDAPPIFEIIEKEKHH